MWTLVKLSLALAIVGLVQAYEDKTVYQYLVDNGYTEFVKLLDKAGLKTQLSGLGPFTVFAPSNDVLTKIDPTLGAAITNNPSSEKILIKYHVAGNFLLVPQVKAQQSIDTLAGQAIDAINIGSALILNNVTRVNNAPNNDIICNNGIVQPIDKVLRPPVFGTDNMAAVLVERDDLFQDFFMSILLSNMTSYFKTSTQGEFIAISRHKPNKENGQLYKDAGEYTLFAPTNDAFLSQSRTLLGSHIPLDKRRALYTEIVKYHMVPGERTAGMLKNGQRLFTLHGLPVNIIKDSNGVVVNVANVVIADIAASNGVIHAIDRLLYPPDILTELQQLYAQYNPTSTPAPSG